MKPDYQYELNAVLTAIIANGDPTWRYAYRELYNRGWTLDEVRGWIKDNEEYALILMGDAP